MLFVDASALVKRYVREQHSAAVRRILGTTVVAISRLSEVEVPSALARLEREGRLSLDGRDKATTAFETDLAAWRIVELTPEVMALARACILRRDLRTGDAIQLASALWLHGAAESLLAGVLAFDARLRAAAAAEGLPVLDVRRRV